MTQDQLNQMIANAVKSALANESEPKAKAKAKAKAKEQASVILEPADRDGIIRAVKVFDGGGRRSLCALSKANWDLIREALNRK